MPFFGRQNEIDALKVFMTAERARPFIWWLIVGGGGAGKTRLGLQLCRHAYRQGWQVGFLPNGFKADVAFLDSWCPEAPTLIVADYVLKRFTDIRTLTARLARRDDLLPIRLLLLEREADERFTRQFLGSDQGDRSVIDVASYAATPLAVSGLSDDYIWSLVEGCPWRTDGARLTISRDEFFSEFRALDKECRVLVAMILADARATSPKRGSLGGLEAELRDLLRRDRDNLWPPELRVAGQQIGETDADVAITFATMIDGLGLSELDSIRESRGKVLSTELLPFCALAIGKPLRDKPLLGRLEPDLIGEFFALETLRGHNPFAQPQHDWMPEAAWRARGSAMADFVTRAKQNFPNHSSINKINITVRGVKESWVLAARSTIEEARTPNQGFDAARKMLFGSARSDLAAAHALADFAEFLTPYAPGVVESPVVTGFLDNLRALQVSYGEDAGLRTQFASSPVNATVSERDVVRRNALFNELRALAQRYAADASVRRRWAVGLFNALNQARKERDFARRDALLDELRALVQRYSEDAAVREYLAYGLFYALNDAAEERDVARRDMLLDELRTLAQHYGQDAAVAGEFGKAIVNTMADTKDERDFAHREALLNELRALAERHSEESAAVRLTLAKVCSAP